MHCTYIFLLLNRCVYIIRVVRGLSVRVIFLAMGIQGFCVIYCGTTLRLIHPYFTLPFLIQPTVEN